MQRQRTVMDNEAVTMHLQFVAVSPAVVEMPPRTLIDELLLRVLYVNQGHDNQQEVLPTCTLLTLALLPSAFGQHPLRQFQVAQVRQFGSLTLYVGQHW
jgi:hypothetical protein